MSVREALALGALDGVPLRVPCSGNPVSAIWPYGFTESERNRAQYNVANGIWRVGTDIEFLPGPHLALNAEEEGRRYDFVIRPNPRAKVRHAVRRRV